jgi:hypothetical protein
MFALKVWSYSTGSLASKLLRADFDPGRKSRCMKGLTQAF